MRAVVTKGFGASTVLEMAAEASFGMQSAIMARSTMSELAIMSAFLGAGSCDKAICDLGIAVHMFCKRTDARYVFLVRAAAAGRR